MTDISVNVDNFVSTLAGMHNSNTTQGAFIGPKPHDGTIQSFWRTTTPAPEVQEPAFTLLRDFAKGRGYIPERTSQGMSSGEAMFAGMAHRITPTGGQSARNNREQVTTRRFNNA